MNYLICGLGNIGDEYAETRHNIGFMVLDRLAYKGNVRFDLSRHAFKSELKYKSRTLHLIKPTTYMNLSGKAVGYWMRELKIAPENILVITDDLAIPFPKLRMRMKGSSGGHNGLTNIQETLGSDQYPRLRFGIGCDFAKGRQVDYVLGKFSTEEQKELPFAIDRAVEGILAFATIGVERAMNVINK